MEKNQIIGVQLGNGSQQADFNEMKSTKERDDVISSQVDGFPLMATCWNSTSK